MRNPGFKHSLTTIEKIRKSNLGKKRSLETCLKISQVKKGEKHPNWKKKLSEQTKVKIGNANRGKKHAPISEATKTKLREASIRNGNKPPVRFGKENNLFGRDCKKEKNPRWISDRSKLQRYSNNDLNRRSYAYAFWRQEVRSRDNYCCKINDKNCNGRLEVHHILSYRDHPELQLEINNGITLCKFHHPRKREDEKKLIPLFKELISI